MGEYQTAFEEVLHDALYSAAADMIADKLSRQGVKMRPREKQRLVAHLKEDAGDSFLFRQWQWWRKDDLTVSVTEAETQELLDRFSAFLEDDLSNVILESTDHISVEIAATLHETWTAELRRQQKEMAGFRRRLRERWGPSIDQLQMCVAVASELGEMTGHSLGERLGEASPILIDTLIRLHARCCQIAQEIVCLLSAGFADGAMARWRTMHEISAVAFLLSCHGESLAERYVAHEAVESFKAANDYKSCCERLGYEPMDDAEYEEIRLARDKALERYGRDFGNQYGWASEVLGKKNPGLDDIQRAAGIDHLRAHYRMASHNVHANPKGVFFKLGLLEESDILLAGPSNAGLSDPGQSAAIALLQVATTLCVLNPDIDSIVGQKILARLTDEACQLFASAHEKLIEEVG